MHLFNSLCRFFIRILKQKRAVDKQDTTCQHMGVYCNFDCTPEPNLDVSAPPYSDLPLYETLLSSDKFLSVVDNTVKKYNTKLRDISIKIHDHPEILFEERYAHDVLTQFMSSHGFKVTEHYLRLETAWKAEWALGKGGRTLGINAEMDALKGIGHACGHNLIATSACGIALAVKETMERYNISGKIVLLGTPGEEGGGGKVILLERGGYDDMDLCIMCHPSPGPKHAAGVSSSLALQNIDVEYFGHTAHAAAAPWEGTNALDAAFLAYSSISVLRQQIKPDHRVHGIVKGGENWSPNIIPDYAGMTWLVRAPSQAEVTALADRVQKCLQAAALATSCKMEMKTGRTYYELRQNDILANEFYRLASNNYGMVPILPKTTASTDFGNVTYVLPALHPLFAIPTVPNGGNHTPAFADAARTIEAHEATMTVTKVLAMTGLKALTDDDFFQLVKTNFDSQRNKND